jgi:uncharacterized protein YjiS (DUF1127 family)
MAYVNSDRIARKGLMDRVAALKEVILTALVQRRVYEKTVAELNALSDRELADLGIARMNIAEIAREAAYGK